MNLETEIQFLKGVGDKKAAILKKEMEIFQIRDLLYTFPSRYVDRSRLTPIAEIDADSGFAVQFRGRLKLSETVGSGPATRLRAIVADHSGQIELVWFKGIKWLSTQLKIGQEYLFFGKPTIFNGRINFSHPELEAIQFEEQEQKGIMPQYSVPEKLKSHFINSKYIQKLIKQVLDLNIPIEEHLPSSVIESNQLMSLGWAIRNIHFPQSENDRKRAEHRIKFEEFFYIQLKLLVQKQYRIKTYRGHIFNTIGPNFNRYFNECLPFELTGAQKRVIKEIRQDVKSGRQMNRLLQGDVGSGKTMVAIFSMLLAIDNGMQAAIMAPTEILAQQHYNSIAPDLEQIGLNVFLLTGSSKKSERDKIHQALIDGTAHILIGTHALIENNVQFQNLGLVVIDEQHRFGVSQRAKLWAKNTVPPHMLIMTATPIPRTLSMTLYGDLDVSIIDELPPGRKAIETKHVYDNQQSQIFKFMHEQINLGRQIYVVFPLIKESEKLDYKALEEGFWAIHEAFPPPKFSISIVHGQVKAKDKEIEMQRFIKGQAQIMVATTVIEVGVNVPNASVMVIENADRFGLSQLHQLRGRVGRGADQSYCILKTPFKLSQDSRTRIKAMVDSTDGFKLAEIDMQLRGPGAIEGTQQSGIPFDFKLANLLTDQVILQKARQAAEMLTDEDPQLELAQNQLTRAYLKKHYTSKVNWSKIG
jgi:ATP-dependent DNA helicase RecG